MGARVDGLDWRGLADSRPSRLAFVTLAFGVALAVSHSLSWLAGHIVGVGEPGTISRLLVGVLALQLAGFGGVVAVVVWIRGKSWRPYLRVGQVTEWVVFYGTAAGLAMMVVASLATGLFRLLDLEPAESAAGAADDPLFYVVLLVVSTLVVVPMEEAFFRGFVQTRLEERFHPGVALGVASLFFVVVHTNVSVGSGGEVLALGLFFSLGVVLGVSYSVTENLVVPIIGHAVYNGTQIFVRTLEVLA
jgi:membrane protease YdiL (CAAX protease family)